MILNEFLNQTQYIELDENQDYVINDESALADAQAYEEVSLVRIDTDTRKTAVATVDIFNGTVERLTDYVPHPELTVEQQEQARILARMIKRALENLFNTQFYINLNDQGVADAYSAALVLGVITQVEYDGIYKAAELRTKPFANVTLEQLKAARNPATWQPVSIASGNDKVVLVEGDVLLSASNKAGFSFTLSPSDTFNGQVKIRVLAKKVDETEFTLFDQLSININKQFEAGVNVAHFVQRAVSLSGYRHFQFEYLAPYAGCVAVAVNGVS